VKQIIATEQVLNARGDIIKIIYHYEDGSTREKPVFIPKGTSK